MDHMSRPLACLLLRVYFGVNFFAHGLVRLPKLRAFADGIAQGFDGTLLPGELAWPVALVIPFVELSIGLLLLAGWQRRVALCTGLVLMTVLTFGASMMEQWAVVGTQVVYALVFFLLLFHLEHDRLAFDTLRRAGSTAPGSD